MPSTQSPESPPRPGSLSLGPAKNNEGLAAILGALGASQPSLSPARGHAPAFPPAAPSLVASFSSLVPPPEAPLPPKAIATPPKPLPAPSIGTSPFAPPARGALTVLEEQSNRVRCRRNVGPSADDHGSDGRVPTGDDPDPACVFFGAGVINHGRGGRGGRGRQRVAVDSPPGPQRRPAGDGALFTAAGAALRRAVQCGGGEAAGGGEVAVAAAASVWVVAPAAAVAEAAAAVDRAAEPSAPTEAATAVGVAAPVAPSVDRATEPPAAAPLPSPSPAGTPSLADDPAATSIERSAYIVLDQESHEDVGDDVAGSAAAAIRRRAGAGPVAEAAERRGPLLPAPAPSVPSAAAAFYAAAAAVRAAFPPGRGVGRGRRNQVDPSPSFIASASPSCGGWGGARGTGYGGSLPTSPAVRAGAHFPRGPGASRSRGADVGGPVKAGVGGRLPAALRRPRGGGPGRSPDVTRGRAPLVILPAPDADGWREGRGTRARRIESEQQLGEEDDPYKF